MSVMNINDILESEISLKAQLDMIRQLKPQMLAMIATGTLKGPVQEYQMNTGQSIVRTQYRSMTDLFNGYKGLELIENTLIAKLTGRQTNLINDRNRKVWGR
jgi:hypothetical protein